MRDNVKSFFAFWIIRSGHIYEIYEAAVCILLQICCGIAPTLACNRQRQFAKGDFHVCDCAWQRVTERKLAPLPVLAADTTVCVGDAILAKPADDADAARMLRLLSGREHRVLSAVALQSGDRRLLALNDSQVRFRELADAEISAYIASGEPAGKAGAYGIQGRAAAFIATLRGSYSGVMGLPLFETAQLLREIQS